jgi:hypothetical protein
LILSIKVSLLISNPGLLLCNSLMLVSVGPD